MTCLDDNEVADLLGGRLAGSALATARRHLDDCDDCRALLAVAAAAVEHEQTAPLGLDRTAPSDGDRPGEPPVRRGDRIDRYIVLERIGAGAMGAVFAAYDPELERKIAIKLLRTGPEQRSGPTADLRARLLREGQALARLSHPSVITVLDVGTHGDEIFVAMELADGGTLREWIAARPSWREVIAVLGRAGAGLAAAHDAGISHRDFKPDNVLLDAERDGERRVRVTDFGLAVAHASEPRTAPSSGSMLAAAITVEGSVIGTPAYMAPEQIAGRPGPQADQFSFCVTLYEALYGVRPFAGGTVAALAVAIDEQQFAPSRARVPRWLRRVVLRGLAADPAQRYPSMPALLAALRADPARRLRRAGLAALAVAALVAAGLGLHTVHEARALECTGGGRRLAGVWDPVRRIAVGHAFLATGASYAASSLAATSALIDDYASEWTAMHHAACEATRVRREQSESLLDLRMVCLDDHLKQLRTLVDVYATADAEIVEHAAAAARSLSPVAECADARALDAVLPPPRDPARAALASMLGARIDEVIALERTGKWKRGLALALQTLPEARALGYPLRTASLAYVTATFHIQLGQIDDGVALFHEAAREAQRARSDRVATDAWTSLIYVRGLVQGHADEALRWAAYARAANERAGNDEDALASILDYEGMVLAQSGHPAEGLAVMQRMVTLNEKLHGVDDLWTLRGSVNMANVLSAQGRYEEAREIFAHAMNTQHRVLGPTHPDTLLALENYGATMVTLERGGEVLALLQRGLAAVRQEIGPGTISTVSAQLNLAEALAQLDRFAEAEPLNRDALAVLEPLAGDTHPFLAEGLTNLGIDALGLGRPDEAIAPLERALAMHGRLETPPLDAAMTRFTLARALIDRDPARARTLAEAAHAAYAEAGRAFGGHAVVRAQQVAAWLAAHAKKS